MRQFQTLPLGPRASDFAIGGSIFAIGLFKKTCLTDLSAVWVNPVFSAPADGNPFHLVDCRFFLSPQHADVLFAAYHLGLWPELERLKRSLARPPGQHRHAGTPAPNAAQPPK
jgi:hypothetical protein